MAVTTDADITGVAQQSGQTIDSPVLVSPTISDPTISGATIGVPRLLGQQSIPFIHLSTGSVAANGAISGITALPLAYPHAYCYFPANALATAIGAGWYYCTFSTTTAGVAFLDTYTSGSPAIPASPTAVSDGKGAFTGDTSERVAVSFSIAAGALGANGQLCGRAEFEANNTANSKIGRFRLGGLSGTIFATATMTSQVRGCIFDCVVSNLNASNQLGGFKTLMGTTATEGAPALGAVNTAVGTTIDFTLSKATATDNLVADFSAFFINRAA